MFNGIIFNTGKVIDLKKNKNSIHIGIQTKINFNKRDVGSSICCDGVCLTIEKIYKNKIYFYVSKETLKRSNFKVLRLNQTINLEKSLVFGQRLSGHFIQGHVDAVAKIKNIRFIDKSWVIEFKILDKKLNTYKKKHLFLLTVFL